LGQGLRRVPKWEAFGHTPAVFVRVANAGLRGGKAGKKERRKAFGLRYPYYAWGISHGYQRKGVTGGAVWMIIKTREIGKPGAGRTDEFRLGKHETW
jgi:hypothetical protein